MLGQLKSTHYETANKKVMLFSIAIMPHLHGNSLINIFCNESVSSPTSYELHHANSVMHHSYYFCQVQIRETSNYRERLLTVD